jgi:hypothetical protein
MAMPTPTSAVDSETTSELASWRQKSHRGAIGQALARPATASKCSSEGLLGSGSTRASGALAPESASVTTHSTG